MCRKVWLPRKGLKETVNKSNGSAPSKQCRAVAVWGLSSGLASPRSLLPGQQAAHSPPVGSPISARPSPTSVVHSQCAVSSRFPRSVHPFQSLWIPCLVLPIHHFPGPRDPALALPSHFLHTHLPSAAGPGVSAGGPAARSSQSTEALRLLLRGRDCFWAVGSGSMSGERGWSGGPVPGRPTVAGTVPASFCEAVCCLLAESCYRHHPGI